MAGSPAAHDEDGWASEPDEAGGALDALSLESGGGDESPRRHEGRPSTAPAHPDANAVHQWGREGHLTPSQAAHLAAFKRKLPTLPTDECLRWLRGRAFNVSKALALKTDCEAWWRDRRPAFSAPAQDMAELMLHRKLVCWSPLHDLHGRSVVVIDVSQHHAGVREAALASLLACLDGAIAATPSHELTIVFDLRKYTLANADGKTAVTMVKALQVGYPERLGLAVFLGAPRVFGLLWRVVRVLLDARTVSKVHFVQQEVEMDPLVGLHALPPAQGGRNTRLEAHMRRFCDSLAAAAEGGAAPAEAPLADVAA